MKTVCPDRVMPPSHMVVLTGLWLERMVDHIKEFNHRKEPYKLDMVIIQQNAWSFQCKAGKI